jgi:hypothetical protein
MTDPADQYVDGVGTSWNSIQEGISFSSETQNAVIGVNWATPVKFTLGTTISFYYRVLSTTGQGNQNAQVLWEGTSGTSTAGWINNLSASWALETVTLSADAAGVTQIGMQILYGGTPNPGGAEAVTIEIADVNININTVPTPTPGNNGVTWTFSDCGNGTWTGPGTANTGQTDAGAGTGTAALDGWMEMSPTGGTDLSIASITALPTSGLTSNGSNCAMAVAVPSSVGSANDVEALFTFITAMDWSSMALHGVSFQYICSSSLTSYGTAYPIIKAGTAGDWYGGTYEAFTASCNTNGSGCSYGSSSTWQTVNFAPGSYTTNGNWSTDQSDVIAVGVDVNDYTSTSIAGSFYIDNIILY